MSLGQQQLGEQIKKAREAKGLSQMDLAEAVGLAHPQSISNYERGIEDPPLHRLRRIAEATAQPISYFTDTQEESELLSLRGRVEVLERDLAEIRRAQEE